MPTESNLSESRHSISEPFLYGCILIVLLAASLRIYHISQRSLWLDEAIAANISRGTLDQTLVLTRGLHSAPIADPLILLGVEKIAAGPTAVRTPSLIASLLAVILMLCFVRIPSIGQKTAILSSLMLSISAAQIRYAQEVREYSLSVLYATLLLYLFLSFTSKSEQRQSPTPLYIALFAAPLVQYGLVLFSSGILAALLILWLIQNEAQLKFSHILKAGMFLAAGGLISFVLTLRYQWGEAAWYLEDYYWARGSNLLHFVLVNTHHLFTFLLPGLPLGVVAAIAIVVHLFVEFRARTVSPLTILAITSIGTVLVCALLHRYPYGGIRQCLFLAPVLCLLASASMVELADRFTGRMNTLAFTAIAGVVVVSGVYQIRLLKPYMEVEDIQTVLHRLQNGLQLGDEVYIYPGAVPAVDFYVKDRDRRFIYGDFNQQAPEKLVLQILATLPLETKRLWIVFSHIYRDEDQRILHDLGNEWQEERVVFAKGAALYLLQRHPTLARNSSTDLNARRGDPTAGTAESPSIVDRGVDGFWEWNVRNSRPQPAKLHLLPIFRSH